jgi:hypothetical protein
VGTEASDDRPFELVVELVRNEERRIESAFLEAPRLGARVRELLSLRHVAKGAPIDDEARALVATWLVSVASAANSLCVAATPTERELARVACGGHDLIVEGVDDADGKSRITLLSSQSGPPPAPPAPAAPRTP